MTAGELRIAVVGAGANGAAIAAGLVQAGRQPIVVDQWPENVEAIRRDGVLVRTVAGERRTSLDIHHLCDVATLRGLFDVVLLVVKTYDTRWACELIAPMLSPAGVVVGIQNGMTMDTVADVVGPERSIGAVIEVAANMYEPGIVNQQAPFWFAVGAADQSACAALVGVESLLSDVGATTRSDDIRSSKWMKLVANAAELGTSAICGLPLGTTVEMPGMRGAMVTAGREAMTVAIASGARLMPVFGFEPADGLNAAEGLLDRVLTDYTLPDTRTTVLQDWDKGRRAEVDDINGFVVRQARDSRIDVPMNRRIAALAREIESGVRRPSTRNAVELVAGLATDSPHGER